MKLTKRGWPQRNLKMTTAFKSKCISAHMSVEDAFDCPAIMSFHDCGHVSFVPDAGGEYGQRQYSAGECPNCKENT